ncbi:uncharacterized protein LOC110721683 [Chenopodium quinoa]|nr:uncharacterized protein LOC110721683 [Chenopodium quinoa]
MLAIHSPVLLFTFISFILVHSQLKWVVEAQVIPPNFDGFVHGNPRKFNPKRILIEAFFDPLCPDTRDSWPPLKHALHHYGSKVSLVVHPFPLPYHDNAYVSSRAIHVVNELNKSATFPLWESFFKGQEQFYNEKTSNWTRNEAVDHIVDFVTKTVGEEYKSDLISGLNDPNTDQKTRVSFKYASSRGVIGTPSFIVNGFALPDEGSAIDYKAWRKVIDPLVSSKK